MSHNRDAPVLDHNRETTGVARGCFARLNGAFMIVGSLGIGLVGWFALSNIAANIQEDPALARDMPQFAKSFIQSRSWLLIIALPALLSGGLLLSRPWKTPLRWTLILLGDLWLFALMAMIIYCFVLSVAPLYEYQEL